MQLCAVHAINAESVVFMSKYECIDLSLHHTTIGDLYNISYLTAFIRSPI